MNLILKRTKEEDTFILWEPFATSTPVKTVSVNTKFKNDLQLLTKIDSGNFRGLKGFDPSNNFQSKPAESKHLSSKMVKKSNLNVNKKSSGYIDLYSSSSDDDSNENKKRPIIKLSTKKNTTSLLNNKKPENEEIENTNSGNFQQKDDGSRKINVSFKNRKKNVTADFTLQKDRIQKGKNKTKNSSENLKTDPRATSLITSESGRIFDRPRYTKNSVNETKPSLKNIENIDHSKNDEKFNLSNVIKNEETGLKEIPKISEKSACRQSNISYYLRNQKRPLKADTENHEVRKLHMKGISITKAKKTATKKANDKSAIQSENLENYAVPVKNQMNLTHQLFSYIKEQEFINSLDLTSEEINDAIGHVKCSLWQKQKNLPYKQCHQTNQSKGVFKEEEEPKRPKRRTQRPKQFWLPQNTSDEILQNMQSTFSKPKSNPDVLNTSDGQVSGLNSVTKAKEKNTLAKEHKENDQESNKVTESLSKKAPRAERKRKKENLPEEKNFCPYEDALITSTGEKKLKNMEVKCMLGSGLNVDNDKEAEPNKVPVKDAALEKEADKAVFRQLGELSFNKSEMGCSTVQCWNINNFKCGVFKLKAETEFTSKTLHRNSHLGGVLVKGTLKMKIQDRELELKEGDMAFVPPLTDWQATNTGECEALFYYWCGRFK